MLEQDVKFRIVVIWGRNAPVPVGWKATQVNRHHEGRRKNDPMGERLRKPTCANPHEAV